MMIGNRAQRLIGKTLVALALTATLVLLVMIYARSGGNGTGAGTLALASGTGRGGGGSSGGSGGAEAPTQSTGGQSSGPPPPPSASAESSGGSGSSAGAGTTAPLRPGAAPNGTYTGPVISTIYGPVQVAVAEEGGKIVDVKAVQVPTEHPESLYISERVTPLLREEVLRAQGPEIAIVSGATFTSEGFAESLQKALSHVH